MNKENKVEFWLNDLAVKGEEFYNVLKIGGIKPNHDLLYFNHRKLVKLLNMSGEELYNLIRETTGSRLYQERRAETFKILDKTEVEKERSEELLIELERKVETLKMGKSQWKEFDKKDKQVQVIRYLLYGRKEEMYEGKLEEIGKGIRELTREWEEEKEKRDQALKRSLKNKEILRNQKKREEILEQQEREWVGILQRDVGRQRDELSKEIKKEMEERQKREREDRKRVKKLEKVEEEYQEALRRKMECERKIRGNKEEGASQGQISKLEKKIENLQKKIKSVSEQQAAKQKKIQINEKDLNSKLEEFKRKNKEHETLKEEKYKCMVEENELGAKLQKTEAEVGGFRNHLESFYGGNSVLSVSKLVGEARRRKLPGIVGIVAELIQISDKNLSPLFETLFREKMFSVVVERETDISPLFELNKELKGAKVRVLPLEWFDSETMDKSKLQTSALNMSIEEEQVVLFTNCYEVKEEFDQKEYSVSLAHCLNEIFKKGAIAETVEQAFEIAKKRKLSCVTSDLQVVYSGGYTTRAGYQSTGKMYLSTFNLFQEKRKHLNRVQRSLGLLEKRKLQIQGEEEERVKTAKGLQDIVLSLKMSVEKLCKGRFN